MDGPEGQGVAEQNGPEGDGFGEGGTAAPPADLVLQGEWRHLFGRVFATYARRLWALLVVVALPAVPVTLLSQVLVVAPARDGVYLNGVLEPAADPLTPSVLVAAGILAVLGLAVAPIALGGATLLGTAALLAAPLSLLLACAPVVYSGTASSAEPFITPRPDRYDERGGPVGPPREEPRYVDPDPARDLDLVRVGQRLPAPADPGSGHSFDSAFGGPRLVVVPAVVVAVFGPPLLGPGLLAANPFGLPELAAYPVGSAGRDELSASIEPTAEGARVGVAANTVVLEACEPECRVVRKGGWTWKGSGVRVGDGGALWTVWREYEYEYEYEHEDGDEEDRYAPHPDSGLYLLSCTDITDCETPEEETQVRQYTGRHHDVVSAVVPLADGRLLVASSVRRYDPPELGTTVEEDRGGLRLHLCEDTTCADPEVVLLPPEMAAGGFLVDGDFLVPAASPGGGYAMAVTDAERGSLSLVACAEEACTDPEVTEIHGDRFHSKHESRFRGRFGARVEFRSDGTPVLSYRDPQGGRARLVDCHDALCAEFTDTAVTGPGWARPVPGLAVDSRDRVHVLTPDFAQERLVLVSCLDRSCSETSAVPLVALAEGEPSLTVLALDELDRPYMLWGQGQARTRLMGGTDFESEAEYLRCVEPLCGSRW